MFDVLDLVSDGKFVCDYCLREFVTRGALSNHRKTHSNSSASLNEPGPIRRRKRPTSAQKLKILSDLASYFALHGEHAVRAAFDRASGFSKQTISNWVNNPRLRLIASLPDLACMKRARSAVLAPMTRFKAEQDMLFASFVYRRRGKGQQVRLGSNTNAQDHGSEPTSWLAKV